MTDMGLISKLVGKRTQPVDETVSAVSSEEAVTRVMKSLSRGAPPAVAQAGAEIATALNTVETAILAIDTIADLLIEAELLTATARDTQSAGRRALIANRYNKLLHMISTTIGRAEHNGMNLLDANRNTYEIKLDSEERASIALHVADLTTGPEGLDLSTPQEAFTSQVEVERTIAEIDAARRTTARCADLFADSSAVLAERLARLDQDFGPAAAQATQRTGASQQ
jgi:flagellin-like hook-associated protein FlgL